MSTNFTPAPTDNLQENLSSAPEISDNAIADILDGKPVNDEKPAQDNNAEVAKENSEKEISEQSEDVKIPDKFKNEDGSINQDALLKSYLQLEPLVNEKSELSKQNAELLEKAKLAEELQNEREILAKNLGFENFSQLSEYQQKILADTKFAKYQANEYARYLHTIPNSEDVRAMLVSYAQNPNQELLKQIESEFDTDTIKKVTQELERFKFELKQESENEEKRKQLETEKEEYLRYQTEAKEFITDAITRHKNMFDDLAFKELFSECIKVAGNQFVTDELVRIVNNIRENAVNKYISEQAQTKENENATDLLRSVSPQSHIVDTAVKNPDLNKLSGKEIDKLVSELI